MIIPQIKTKENIFNEQNLKTIFTETAVSNDVTITYLEDFKKSIWFSIFLNNHLGEFNSVKGANSTYKPIGIVDFMIDVIIYGYTRYLLIYLHPMPVSLPFCPMKKPHILFIPWDLYCMKKILRWILSKGRICIIMQPLICLLRVKLIMLPTSTV